jgi:hypothetical protein
MRKLTKKQCEFARKEFTIVEAMILDSGGVKHEIRKMYQFEIPTVCGTLSISLDVGYYIFSIHCRFADVRQAVEHFKNQSHSPSINRLNPFSGKWNFNDTDATDLVTAFFMEINPLLNGMQKPI